MVDFHKLALRPIIEAYGKPFAYTPPGATEPAQLADGALAVLRERHTPRTPDTVDAEVSLMGYWLLVDLSDFPKDEPRQLGTFEIGGETFTAKEIQDTGNGGARVPVRKVS